MYGAKVRKRQFSSENSQWGLLNWGRRREITSILLCHTIVIASACPSIPRVNNWAREAVGSPISLAIHLDEESGDVGYWYDLPNGNRTYVTKAWKSCEVHFEVNPSGIIVGYRLTGC